MEKLRKRKSDKDRKEEGEIKKNKKKCGSGTLHGVSVVF